MPERGSFRWRSRMVHLTYKHHQDPEALLEKARAVGPLKGYSIVWEEGKDRTARDQAEVATPTPYEHTHFLVWWEEPPDSRDARLMDIDGVHPHVRARSSKVWWLDVYKRYHWKAPLGPEGLDKEEPAPLQDPPNETLEVEELEEALTAPTLKDACRELNIIPRSVSDVAILRREQENLRINPPKYTPDQFNLALTDPEVFNTKSLIAWGPPGIGKTQWAKAHFRCPLLVNHMDVLKSFKQGVHDGIIFDDMDFNGTWCLRDTQIALLDQEEPRDIHCRYRTAFIPAGTPKIFCTNQDRGWIFPFDDQALKRRAQIIHIPMDIRKA